MKKDITAREIGALGGKATAKKSTKKQLFQRARRAAQARWKK